MAKRDYYEVLGVNKNATPDQIKSAYRKLAVKHHPDKNKGDKAAEEKFKEASEAYHVLSNTERKQSYDNFGHAAFENGGGGRGGFGNFDFSRKISDFSRKSTFLSRCLDFFEFEFRLFLDFYFAKGPMGVNKEFLGKLLEIVVNWVPFFFVKFSFRIPQLVKFPYQFFSFQIK